MKYLRWMKALALSGTAIDMTKGQYTLVNYILALSDKYPLRKHHSLPVQLLTEATGLSRTTLQRARTDAIASGWLECVIGGASIASKYKPACPFTEQEINQFCGFLDTQQDSVLFQKVEREVEQEVEQDVGRAVEQEVEQEVEQGSPPVFQKVEQDAEQERVLITPIPSPFKDACMHAEPLTAHPQETIQWFLTNGLCVFAEDVDDLIVLSDTTDTAMLNAAIAYCKKKRIDAGERLRPCKSDLSRAVAEAKRHQREANTEKQRAHERAAQKEKDAQARADSNKRVERLNALLAEIDEIDSHTLENMLFKNVRNWSTDRSKITVFSTPEILQTLDEWRNTSERKQL